MNSIVKHLLCFIGIFMAIISVSAQTDNYGAGDANKRFMPSLGMLGGQTEFDYLNLKNHPGNSGVPLGGIGVGNVQFAPDGRFARIGMNNIHLPIRKSTASFFSVWYNDGVKSDALMLVNDQNPQYGIAPVEEIYYKGLFPQAEMSFGNSIKGVDIKIHAYSSLIPHDVKNSSLPVAFFDVELESEKDTEIAVAFSWEDFIGRGIKEPKSIEGLDGQIFSHNRDPKSNGERWPDRALEQTFSEKWDCGTLSGIRQFSAKPLKPIRANFQNYVNEVALLAEKEDDIQLSILPAYDIKNGNNAWKSFKDNGIFENTDQNISFLSTPSKQDGGSAIALKTKIKKGEKKTLRFVLAWYYPEIKIDRENDMPEYYWVGGSDYGRYFHNYFNDINSLVDYAYQKRDFLLEKTSEWQQPVLKSTMPDWYKFKLINSGYVIYTNMILNKKGDMTVNEGGMGGLAGTMDQRISSHPFYQKFFTQLDRSEMDIFADSQQSKGNITHFVGHYYIGMGTVGGRIPTEDSWMVDNTGGWIIQLAKDYQQTGDIKYLRRHVGRVHDGMDFLRSLMPKGLNIPIGPTTYDDFTHPPVYSYGASIYLATLKAAAVISHATGNTDKEKEYNEQFTLTQKDMIRMLWNGRFFSYGCEIDGSGKLDNILFTGQLGGQFVSRYCGWGDVIPMDMVKASLISQFKISLSKTPDYYANKVWDINQNKGIDNRGSQCWPFYLESYTGYPAFQSGYCADALEIMKHIQLVHLRKGWTWCQNLWNPAELSYMTAPVTWFSTDVLAGAGLNVPDKELRLAPVVNGKEKIILPLYYPTFWATLTVEPKTKKLLLEITKTYGNNGVVLSRIVAEPNGESTEKRQIIEIPEFSVKEGKTLDLSLYWDKIIRVNSDKAILPRADKVDFITVK
ncbi:GH116 family glycosyl-hydrolase [Prevotella sp. 10(H)]|uniref:GH116 family glycosyl-hydrolase n=1 Tax=Prevotella sp. 10(H) TaxID=1158294 RepID=UPI0004A70A53|nr:GH116 family glycosyl-hydrolase [Prevotella sp. 10(H)]